MGERKVLNKYYPPDFDPAEMPKGKRAANNEKKVRMMLPMSVRCNTCGNFMYKGTKFNCRMEDVAGETYLGLRIFRFYYRCTACAAEFCMKTDPKSTDYIMEQGATRNYEPWREADVAVAEAVQARAEEEMGNAMKALENRTLDSKREMDIMAALDEVQSLNSRHNKVTTEDALAALQRAAARNNQDLEQEELEDIAEFYKLKQKQLLKTGPSSAAAGGGVVAGVVAGSTMLASSSSSSDEEAGPSSSLAGPPEKKSRQGAPDASHSSAPLDSSSTGGLDSLSVLSKPSSVGTTAVKSLKPAFKVIRKPQVENTTDRAVTNAPVAVEQKEDNVLGLLGGYGSSDDSDRKSS